MNIQLINSGIKNLAFEQRLIELLGVLPSSSIISELMILGFDYASKYPFSLNLESTRGYSYLAPLLRKRSYLTNTFFSTDSYSVSKKQDTLIGTISNRAYLKFFELINSYKKTNPLASSLHIMANTGARANWDQIRQLIGFRGYLSNARGFLYEIPVMQSFNRGLNTYEYFLSSYGARKGVIDTALKTADAGYLTRRLVENTQEFIIKERYCGVKDTVEIHLNMSPEGDFRYPLNLMLWGKTLAKNIIDKKRGNIILSKGTKLGINIENLLFKHKINKISIASTSLCTAGRSICNYCYGFKGVYGSLLGESIGIIGAEAVGEPGTQMTLRTFHTGGVFTTNSKSLKVTEYTNRVPSYFNSHSLFKLIKLKKNTFKLNSLPIISYYTKQPGQLKTNHNPLNIFTTSPRSVLYKLVNNTSYKLNLPKHINLYATSNGYLLSYMPIFTFFVSHLKNKKWTDTEGYLKSVYSGEILFQNTLQLLIKNTNNKWVLFSLKDSLAYQNTLLQTKFRKSGLLLKDISNKYATLKVFHLYPLTYSFKQLTSGYFNKFQKNKIIYTVPLSLNRVNFYIKTSIIKNITTNSVINLKGDLLTLKNITNKYSLLIS